MATVSAYVRPRNLEDALRLLAEPCSVVLGGGTRLNARPTAEPVVVIDLQALGLNVVEAARDDRLRVGAMTTLQQLVDDERLPVVLREAARRSEPSTLRAAATVGGCVASAEPASEFLAALLAHDAAVEILGRDGIRTLALATLFSDLGQLEGRIITAIAIETSGASRAERVGRTRADLPIVAAVARRGNDGQRRLALAGVGPRPLLVSGLGDLDPPDDFRGSAGYRRTLAAHLAARVLNGLP